MRAMLSAFKWDYCLTFVMCTMGSGLSYVSPFLVNRLITFIEVGDDGDLGNALCLLAVLSVT